LASAGDVTTEAALGGVGGSWCSGARGSITDVVPPVAPPRGSWLACGGVVNSGAMGEAMGAMGGKSDEGSEEGGEPIISMAYFCLLGAVRL